MKLISRRSLITGLIGIIAAPAIVRASSLMPVKVHPVLIGMDFASRPDLQGWKFDGNRVWYIETREPTILISSTVEDFKNWRTT